MMQKRNYFLILLLISTSAALTIAMPKPVQEGRVISGIEFDGLKLITRDEALKTSDLKLGQPFKVDEVDAAAQRLLDSGFFRQVGYRTRTAGNKITITFQVEEAGSGDAPVIFDNFIWFTEDELTDAIRLEVPTYNGRIPNVGKTPETVTRVLQQLLTERQIPGTVEYIASQDLGGRILGHVFGVRGVKLPICTLHFPGTQSVPEKKLVEASKEIFDSDYSTDLIKVFARMKLNAIYRELGMLRANFAAPIGKPDSKCKNGVDVTVPVTEGVVYSWNQFDWTGANELTPQQLTETLGVKSGEVANGLQFDKGVGAVMKAYGQQGYLETRIKPTPEFDDNARKVTYKIEITEGPQYRMGGLFFKGLIEKDAKAFRDAWRLKRGDIFDQSYMSDFFKTGGARSVMQRLFDERRSLGGQPPQVSTKIAPNKQALTVDVTIELAN